MHGQCVGVGTYLCAKEYHYLASLPTPKAKPFEPLTRAWVDEKFGPLADGIMKENENDVLGTFDAQNIVDHWDEIRAIIAEIPSAEELAAVEKRAYALGAKKHVNIDVTEEYYSKCIKYMVFGNVLRNKTYPISVSSERTFQALAIVNYATSDHYPWVLWVMAGWGLGQLIHTVDYMLARAERGEAAEAKQHQAH